jgi:hypothetical protein
MTYIEDLATVYAVDLSPIKFDEASPIKNDEAIAPSKMMTKEETEEETDNGGGHTTKTSQAIASLCDFGVSRSVAERLAEERSLQDILAWIAYAERADGVRNPTAFLVARLRDGEIPPEALVSDDRKRYVSGKYADWIQR